MKIVQNQAVQGDVYVRRIAELPKGVKKAEPRDGRWIVAHSETGHHHYVETGGVTLYESEKNPMICYLQIDGGFGDMVHGRSFDTHETLRLGQGVHEVIRQRELTPTGWRLARD